MKNGLKMFSHRKCFFLFAKILLLGMFIFPLELFAQERSISGTVTSVGNEPLIGVSVTIKGTTAGTLTDPDGKFSLPLPAGAQTVVFSFIGMTTREIPIGVTNIYNVALAESVQSLDEVVVVGYGTQKRISVTGAIVAVTGSDLVMNPSSGITNTLAGRVTGVTTVQLSGMPGASDPQVYVRGIGSLTADRSQPLMLVDGVERSFSQMDPNEIESISILKDASATAVYGIRGANGVIIVTTKRGVEGAPKINITTSTGIQRPTYVVQMADSYTYATHYNLALTNDNPDILDSQLTFTPLAIESFRTGENSMIYANSDWNNMLLKPYAIQNQQNINISGGTKLVKYFVSLGTYYQDGLYKSFDDPDTYGFKYNRYNYRANIDLDMTESTKLSLTIGGRTQVQQQPGGGMDGDVFSTLSYAVPFSGQVIDGKHFYHGSEYLPPWTDGLGGINWGSGYTTEISNPMSIDLGLNQKLDFVTKGLAWRVKLASNNVITHEKSRTTSHEVYSAYFLCDVDPAAVGDSTIVTRVNGSRGLLGFSEESSKSRNWYLETALTYDRTFGDHQFTGLLLYNESKKFYPSAYSDIPTGYVGLAGRGTYSYKSKYLLDLNLGYNGSENFAPGNRFGFFPAVSVGWVLSEESFIKGKIPAINYLKVRYSNGVVGNDQQGNSRFLYMPDSYMLSFTENGVNGYSFGTTSSVLQPKAQEGKIGNPDVTWEKANKQNIGVDLRVLKSQLAISADYFYEYRNNILTTASTYPSIFDLSLPAVNLGRVQNQGYEVELRWRSNIGKVNYHLGGNYSFARNKILYMDEVPPMYPYLRRTGQSVGRMWGYVFEGFWNEDDIINLDAFPNPNFDVQPGDVRFRDLNGDNQINDYDQTVIGYPDYPEINYSISGGLEYKGIDFSFLFNGVANCSREMGGTWRFNFGVTSDRGLLNWMAENDWTPETAATAQSPRMSIESGNYNARRSALWLRSANYVRLKNIELGYSFAPNSLKRLGISQMRVYSSGYDLLTFSKLKIFDPEQSTNSQMYPLIEIINLGVNVTF